MHIIRTENPAAAPEAARHAERKAELKMEKDEVQTEYLHGGGHRVGRCGPRRGGTDRWGGARAWSGCSAQHMPLPVEKAAVITAMNLCEELARRDAALRESEEKVRQLEAELHEIGGAEGLRQRLRQAEGQAENRRGAAPAGTGTAGGARGETGRHAGGDAQPRSAKTLESRRGLSLFSPRSDRRRVSFSRSMCGAACARGGKIEISV